MNKRRPCCACVFEDGKFRTCKNMASVVVGKRHYCTKHDPRITKLYADAARATKDAKIARDMLDLHLREAFTVACRYNKDYRDTYEMLTEIYDKAVSESDFLNRIGSMTYENALKALKERETQ